ncbi:MAG: GNAT family N-acetyltransferase [Actinomycetota bacterium]
MGDRLLRASDVIEQPGTIRDTGPVGDGVRYSGPFPVTTLRIYDERGALSDLAPQWRELAAADPSASAFQSPEYANVWWEEFGALRSLALAEVFGDHGELLGILPLSMEPDGSVHFVGDPAIADYLGPVSRPRDRDIVASSLVEVATSMDGFKRLTLFGIAEDSGWSEPIIRAAKQAGLDAREEPEDVCPVIALPGSYESYLESISGKQRHEIRRKAKRLQEAGSYTVRLSTHETLDSDLDCFFQMHRSSQGAKGKFMHEDMAVYFSNLAHAMDAKGWMRLAMMELSGTVVAGIFAFSDGKTYGAYNSSFDHAKRELSPGMVLAAESIRIACEEGCSTFDFLRGDEEYKYRFGAVDRPVVKVFAE